jgi:hypothetical protein
MRRIVQQVAADVKGAAQCYTGTGQVQPTVGYPVNIFLPNSAHLLNFEGFIRQCDFADVSKLGISLHERWVSVHPAVISLVGCAAKVVRAGGGSITVAIPNERVAALRYLQRMKLFEACGVNPELEMVEHEAAGRFIPLTQIQTKAWVAVSVGEQAAAMGAPGQFHEDFSRETARASEQLQELEDKMRSDLLPAAAGAARDV